MTCTCIETANRDLAQRLVPARLATAMDDAGNLRAVIKAEAPQLLGSDTAPTLVADYCPFCGTRYASARVAA